MAIENEMQTFEGFLDSDVEDVDFFAEAEKEEGDPKKPEEGADGGDDPKKPKNPEEGEEEEVEEEENLFEQAEISEEEEEEEEEGEDPKKPKESGEDEEAEDSGESISTLNVLKRKGYLDYELEEGEELTEEKAEELLEDSLDSMIDERFEELFSNAPDSVKNLNKFILKGGDPEEYLKSMIDSANSSMKKDMDLEDEKNQILSVTQGLKEEGYDQDYIDAQIEFLRDSKRLKKHAETHYTKWEKKTEKEEAQRLQDIADQKEAEKKNRRALKSKVTGFLEDNDEVEGFKVSVADRKVLPNYMTEREIKLEDGSMVTQMQKDLMRVLNSPTGSVQIAKLLQKANKQGELSFKGIEETAKTKVTKKVKDDIRRNKNIIKKTGDKKKRTLASYFN